MSNFCIGQEVVCVKSHSQGFVKKGIYYKIQGLRIENCKCKGVVVDVGLISPNYQFIGYPTRCTICNERDFVEDGRIWLCESLFAPLQTASEESDMEQSIKEALEKELFEV